MNPWWQDIPEPDAQAREAALARQARLTKPPGSLGRLEAIAADFAGWQGQAVPEAGQPWITVFAADHGVAAEGVSAYPQAVTAQMIANFAAGGAAISVLARELGARLEVVNLGTVADATDVTGVRHAVIAPATTSFLEAPAMTMEQLERALDEGRSAAARAVEAGAWLFIGGDMGIGNTTSAAAIAAALLGCPAAALAGPGTGLDAAGVARKAALIDRAIARHGVDPGDPLAVLQTFGGFEIAALAGAFLAAASRRLPVLVDGFIATAAALVAVRLAPRSRRWMLFTHRSAEPGHARLLEALAAEPVLSLGMRLGEGSGAAAAVPLLRLALALHAGMATFEEAGVSEG